MTDSIAVLSVIDRVLDAAGALVSGAKFKFYEAGTDTPRTVYADNDLSIALGSIVYTDSAGFPVTAYGGTTKTMVYTGVGDYKVVVTDADDVTLVTLDNNPGAIDTSGFSGGGGVDQSVPVVAKSASFTAVVGDSGNLFDIDCTAGNAVVTLPSAIAIGNGGYLGFRHKGTANSVIIETTLAQTIGRYGAITDAMALTGYGETVWLTSNGAVWAVYADTPGRLNNTIGVITIADRLSAPPGSPAPGARYILTSSPSGAWSSFAQHDVVESDGSGSWIRRTPPSDCGWIAYVQDEDINYQFRNSAWVQDVASDTVAGRIAIATDSDIEAGSSLTLAVPPGRQHRHPSACKGWVKGLASTISASYNVGSISNGGTGSNLTVNWATAFSSANYTVMATAHDGTGNGRIVKITSQAAGSVSLRCVADDGSSNTPEFFHVAAFGDL